MSKVAIVVLNWNGKHFLERFIPGILDHLPDYAELIIADNCSTDDSVDFLKENYPSLRLVINQENGGFAKGYNDALKEIDSEYYVLLNSDIEIKSDWIEPIYELMESDKHIGICQPKIEDQKNPDLLEYAGSGGGYIDYLGFPFCRGRIFQDIEEDKGQFNDIKQIFWATGAAMFIRSNVYHELNGLDEDFFAHMEEIDLCWRAQNAGHKVFYNGASEVYHVGGGTLPKKNTRKAYLNFRNNLAMMVKNSPKKNFYPRLFFKMILDGIAAFKFLLEGDFGQFKAVFKAHTTFYKEFRKNLKKRKELNQKDYKDLPVYSKSIVKKYYLNSVKLFEKLNW